MDNENEIVLDLNDGAEGEGNESEGDYVKLSKADYDKLNQTLGSLKRENKDLKKPRETKEETPEKTTSPDNSLLEKTFLRAAQITAEDEVEFTRDLAKKWNMTIDKLVDDEDFQAKLEKMRTQKSNELATSKVRGGSGSGQANQTAEYWMAKGVPPTPADVPDRKTRASIARAMMASAKTGGKKFYND